jgi:hypothetical protein
VLDGCDGNGSSWSLPRAEGTTRPGHEHPGPSGSAPSSTPTRPASSVRCRWVHRARSRVDATNGAWAGARIVTIALDVDRDPCSERREQSTRARRDAPCIGSQDNRAVRPMTGRLFPRLTATSGEQPLRPEAPNLLGCVRGTFTAESERDEATQYALAGAPEATLHRNEKNEQRSCRRGRRHRPTSDEHRRSRS